jgi:hypothetical protein
MEAIDRRDRRSVSDSSGVTVPADLLSHWLRGLRPRARMSSEKDVSFAKFFSTRAQTKVPAPWRRTSKPSSTRPSMALRTVMREMDSSSARSRSGGKASSGPTTRFSMAVRSARCNCWYSGRSLDSSSFCK